ncbi:hypothetical protein [Candidatus Mesenet endosymbiont of Agriotes lineatus]|uniref:hypothetical protein n=1 Tax=Candidatus Mesenet endosymbiont of Agriotes lineatus TaxID=3077948 RepID=UPI0030D528A5
MLRESILTEENMFTGKSVVRVGDSCEEDVSHFSTHGSSNVFVNCKPVARKSDNFTENKVLTQLLFLLWYSKSGRFSFLWV